MKTPKLLTYSLIATLSLMFAAQANAQDQVKKAIPFKEYLAKTEPSTLKDEQLSSIPIGTYGNGCIRNAYPAKFDHPYYQVIRPQNDRFYGSSSMLSFLDNLATKTHNAGLPILLIGDISLPLGGSFARSNHASHQIGLDVDIWFRMVHKRLSTEELKKPWALNIVKPNFLAVNNYYSENIYTLVKLAATDPQVDRIFINPAIKEKLCLEATGDRSWLRKVRPWWGHNAHMHVRLLCPSDAKFCNNAPPIPGTGDGCGKEVTAWLDDIRYPKPKKPKKAKPKKTTPPKLCLELFAEQKANHKR